MNDQWLLCRCRGDDVDEPRAVFGQQIAIGNQLVDRSPVFLRALALSAWIALLEREAGIAAREPLRLGLRKRERRAVHPAQLALGKALTAQRLAGLRRHRRGNLRNDDAGS